MADPVAQRLERIEASLAHLEHRNDQLDAIVLEQGRTITRLQSLVRRLSESIERAESERIRADTRKPPHSARPSD